MRKICIITLSVFFGISLFAQESFYYYKDKKIHLQQRTDKIFIRTVQGLQKEQILALIDSDTSVQLTLDKDLDKGISEYLMLEAREGSHISTTTLELFKARAEIISATFPFHHNEIISGLIDEFMVKLKQNTSFEQLQNLAKVNNCTIGKENLFVKNQFMIHVSKFSCLNAMLMSNLFYETGLFAYSEPNLLQYNKNFNVKFNNKLKNISL